MINNYYLSIILPVINETHSLDKTIDVLINENSNDVHEIIIVVSEDKTTKESHEHIQKNIKKYQSKIKLYFQKLPFLGGAIRDGFKIASGSHILIMGSDLETNPFDVKKMILLSKKKTDSIITASRWLEKGNFVNYGFVKYYLNYIFQSITKALFLTSLTDMTYGFRIFPSDLVKKILWSELRHPFLLETITKPIRLGIKIYEIPSVWKARIEGKSQNSFLRNFDYFRVIIKSRFIIKKNILK